MTDSHYDTVLPGGAHWSFRARRGLRLQLTDTEGGGNCAALFYNPENLLERYNAPDTLKCQHTFRLTRGHCLYSDMGRVFCSIVEDTAGWHETVCGSAGRAATEARFGRLTYQQARNDRHQNGHDSFLVELAKYGLGRRDLAANVNFFARVTADADGTLHYAPGASPAGARVVLRFEMDTLVLLHTCPHPLAPAGPYPRKPIGVAFLPAQARAPDDYCEHFRPENGRGFRNNALYHLGAGDGGCA